MRKQTCSCDNTAAFVRCEHTWISLRAQKDMFRRKNLLRSHAGSTVGSLSVRKKTCSCDNTAAFARCEYTWISLRSQSGMFCEKPAAFSRREHSWIFFRAQRDVFHLKDCRDLALPPKIDDFTCGRQTQFLQSSAHKPLALLGTRDPKPQSPRLCFTDCRPHKRIRCWGIKMYAFFEEFFCDRNMETVLAQRTSEPTLHKGGWNTRAGCAFGTSRCLSACNGDESREHMESMQRMVWGSAGAKLIYGLARIHQGMIH